MLLSVIAILIILLAQGIANRYSRDEEDPG